MMPDEVQRNPGEAEGHGTGCQPSGGGAFHDAHRKCGQQVRVAQQLERVQKGGCNSADAPMAPDTGQRLID